MILLLLASPAAAQILVPQGQPLPGSPLYQAPAPTSDPASAYITAGQDEPGYRIWYGADPTRALRVKAFNDYLATYEVAGIVPTWQLLRTATSWKACGAQPFEVPPTVDWSNVVQTLRYVRDYVVPAVGAVEPVSAYRNPTLNVCAGGAPLSAHQDFHAVDLVPLRPTTRAALMQDLCAAHLRRGGDYQVGLGFYAFLRFHVDSLRFRKWGVADSGEASPCRVAIAKPAPSPAPVVVAPTLGTQPSSAVSSQPSSLQPLPGPLVPIPGLPTSGSPGAIPTPPASATPGETTAPAPMSPITH
jgi:hypothetical protein